MVGVGGGGSQPSTQKKKNERGMGIMDIFWNKTFQLEQEIKSLTKLYKFAFKGNKVLL